jgi:hypothetical protein
MGRINYTVWSDVFICPTCSKDIVFWDVAVDKERGKVRDLFRCNHCMSELKKANCKRAQESHIDRAINKTVAMAKQVPVLINYTVGKTRYEKVPAEHDLALIEKINSMEIPYWYPTNAWPKGQKTQEPIRLGMKHVHQFYTRRNLAVLATFCHQAKNTPIYILMQAVAMVNSKMYRYRWAGGFAGAGGGPLPGTYYIPSIIKDISMIKSLYEFAKKTHKAKSLSRNIANLFIITTQSLGLFPQICDNTCDYIFTDPPFGNNLNYSELNFLWEAWLKVITNNKTEAIINPVQQKGLPEYLALMTRCFAEYYRVLKPGRWMTVEFHNSQNAVWNAIQESLQRVGFVIADVRTLDKQQGSFNQATTTSAVKQDLVISAYKPKDSFRREFAAKAGSPDTAWAFVRLHLENLPVAIVKNRRIEVIAERQDFLLFDRMVAYHIMNGLSIPMDSGDFYKGLDEQFLKRDGMYFLPDQINEYDTARRSGGVDEVERVLFITSEKSAIAWLYQQLEQSPLTYGEIQPRFLQENKAVSKFEAMPELVVMLEDNFVKDDSGRYYIPDITKAADVAKLRDKKLVKEFEGYLQAKGRLTVYRLEAIRAGFTKLWKESNYSLILDTARRLPPQAIAEDEKLLMLVDMSSGRV